LLLVGNGVLPLLLLELLRGRVHGLGRRGHLLLKRAELAVLPGELSRLESAREGKRLVAERGLSVRQELRGFGGLFHGRLFIAKLLERPGNHFLFTPGALRGIAALVDAPSSIIPAAALLLVLREFPFDVNDLDEHHV